MKLSEIKKPAVGWHLVKNSKSVAGPFKAARNALSHARNIDGYSALTHVLAYGVVDRDSNFEEREAPEDSGADEAAEAAGGDDS